MPEAQEAIKAEIQHDIDNPISYSQSWNNAEIVTHTNGVIAETQKSIKDSEKEIKEAKQKTKK